MKIKDKVSALLFVMYVISFVLGTILYKTTGRIPYINWLLLLLAILMVLGKDAFTWTKK